VPKTIDNDIAVIDRTFGFDTACTEAERAIDSAYVEATCNANCIGLVKLMGRHAGFITMNAVLAARNVDICLLPEMDISLDKVIEHVLELMQTKGHCVIVVAEGCGDTLIQSSDETDAGGNKKLADVGPWLKDRIMDRFKEVKLPLTIKYIDPTYMIRAVPPNCADRVYCSVLAQNSVHAAMAGFTGVTAGRISMRYVLLPIEALVKSKPKRVDPCGRWMMRLTSTTKQPSYAKNVQRPISQSESKDIMVAISDPVDMRAALADNDEIRRVEPAHLSEVFGTKAVPNSVFDESSGACMFVDSDSWITQVGVGSDKRRVRLQMMVAGPRRLCHFQPEEVAAAIVTCGNPCPGVNSVVRELVMMLWNYGVRKVYGIMHGFNGVTKPHTWVTLRPESVKDLHMLGGSILQCDVGHPPAEEMAKALQTKGVKQFFLIGGRGTHLGGQDIQKELERLNCECSVVGIPQSVENDLNLLDRSFGFDTATTEAEKAIQTAFTEATCKGNCVGLVKLMGRQSGYLTLYAVLAARHVDICLLPEMDINLEKVLEHTVHLLQTQNYAIIVVAEGCGDTLTDAPVEDVGLWLQEAIYKHCKSVQLPCSVRYVDPTYMVRAVPANASDSIYCSVLAHTAVHGAMAGYTGFATTKVDERYVYMPMHVLTNAGTRRVDTKGPWMERLVATTMQPNLAVDGIMMATPLNPNKAPRYASKSRKCNTLVTENDEIRTPNTTLMLVNGFGETTTSRPLRRSDLINEADQVRALPCFHLSQRFGLQKIPSSLRGKDGSGKVFMDDASFSTQAMVVDASGRKGMAYYKMTRAGAREMLHFDPCDPAACALIVSCGGICPGLNSVIREVVNTLWQYGVRKIWGVRGGYKGVMEPHNWLKLTPEVVNEIHMKGGTMLISDRGNPPHLEMAKVLQKHNVKQYFVLGGDGTHKGAMQTFDCLLEINHECAVVGVPKTIDNDVPMMDQTFGFDTACTEALKAVESAYIEAISNANCIGLVKLMGRHCGHITMNATLAANCVDICLLPEMDIDLDKVLEHTLKIMKTKGHCVIVVAEGCGDTIIRGDGETDAGGNKKLADVGPYLKDSITKYFKQESQPVTIKFIDPTYMIRSVPANSFDSGYCSVLAQNAVHGAMAGFSGITVGKFCHRYVYLPIHAITKQKGKAVDVKGKGFLNLINSTLQPDFAPDGMERLLSARENPIDALSFLSQAESVNCVLKPGDQVRRLDVVNLSTMFTSAMVANPLRTTGFVSKGAWSTQTLQQFNKREVTGHTYLQMVAAGPREYLHFDPQTSSACIVNCGGLCPGLNAVIRELVMMLTAYGVKKIYGCKGGYKGLVTPEKWITLTPETVQDIHTLGGTVLVSDRGNPPHSEIAQSLKSMGVKQYFVLGGDGTHKGGMQTFEAMQQLEDGPYECAVVGVPKTIDNDIAILDKTFGFNTAVTEAERAIDAAYVEAKARENCIGLVKLMGRHCGFIALEATLSARHVDVCLLPEMDISLPRVLKHCMHLIKTKKHAVIVVAEGCGDTLIKSTGGTDAGGNKVLADVGTWLKKELEKYFEKMHEPLHVRYIDPTYMIRAVPSNANDTVFCTVLAQYAVHAAMAGYTGITVGKVDENYVLLPIHAITKGTRRVNIKGRQFDQMIHTTTQPDFSPGPGDDWALLPAPPQKKDDSEIVADRLTDDQIRTLLGEAIGQRPSTAGGIMEEEVNVPDTKLKIFNGYGEILVEQKLQRSDLLQAHDEVRALEVKKLSEWYPSRDIESPLKGTTSNFQDDESWAVQAFSLQDRVDSVKGMPYYQMVRAGPRGKLHFDPADETCCAAIISVGDLCPGMNSVIRQLVNALKVYGVPHVYGIPMGFDGIPKRQNWIELTPESVEEIHMDAGCILGAAHGHKNAKATAQALSSNKVKQLFIIGGDGSQKGAVETLAELRSLDYEISIINVPKTIDNDLPIMDKTFGFDTAVGEAGKAIDAAYVEATCNANCIGFVKLLGKESGFLALNASLSSRVVDLCLLPEMDVDLDKLLDYCEQLMERQGYGVIVMAEGCGGTLLAGATVPGASEDVGLWLKDEILARFKRKQKPLTIKYIDPTDMIRAVPANAQDSVYCSVLAQHAVNGAMAGFTGVTVAKVYERIVYLPTLAFKQLPLKRVNCKGRWFFRLLFATKQPDLSPDVVPERPKGTSTDKALKASSHAISINKVLDPGDEVHRLEVINLASKFASRNVPTPLGQSLQAGLILTGDSWSTQTFTKWGVNDAGGRKYLQLLRSGPRGVLHWDPSEDGFAAAIVTCGGICPGLNSVIRELVKMLRAYGVRKVYGIIGGFKGAVQPETWIELTEERVQNIHNEGGSILVSDRGNPPHPEIAKSLAAKNIRQYFVLGGDGTHKGAMQTFDAMQDINYECSVVGIPKTIDNDIALLDTSFGFDTASTEAAKAIVSAYVESTTNANCIGLVKLMGRHCGFIAALATLAAQVVDVCLIPEMDISKEKLLDYVVEVMKKKSHAVIVVAEGCGDTIIKSEGGATDAGGNKVLADVGPYLKDEITSHFKKRDMPISIKYIDPTYMIRSVPANAYDSLYCATLAQQAVHGAMAGYSGISVGKVDERYVMLPIHAITGKGTRNVDVNGRMYERLMATTKQPSFAP